MLGLLTNIQTADYIFTPSALTLAFALFIIFSFAELYMRIKKFERHKHSTVRSKRLEKAILYFRENKTRIKITNDIHQDLTKVSDITATRDLEKLVELGFLTQSGKGRGVYYRFNKSQQKIIPRQS